MSQGRFITLEGSEGAGKSTNLEHMAGYLRELGKDVLITREPGGTDLGERVRSILLDTSAAPPSPEAELLLMFAARAHHVTTKIAPALAAGRWVLCDRFTDASYAYQGSGRGVDRDKIAALESRFQGGLRPDLTVLLDLPVELGLERAGRRGEADRFERETVAFFERVRAGYLERARSEPDRIRVIDASRDIDAVSHALQAALEGLLEAERA